MRPIKSFIVFSYFCNKILAKFAQQSCYCLVKNTSIFGANFSYGAIFMKKIALVSAIALASISSAHAVPTVYGKAFLTLDYTNTDYDASNKKDESTTKLNSNSSRIGFKGDEELMPGTNLVYQLEYQVNVDDNSAQFTSRNTYIGLQNNQMGTILAGRHDTPFKLVQNKVDVFNDTVLDMAKAGVSGEVRADNVIAYQSPAIVGMPVTFMGAVSLNECTTVDGDCVGTTKDKDGKTIATKSDKKTPYSASLVYDQNGVYLGGAYDKNVASDNAWRVVGALDMGKMNMVSGLTLGALYQQADFNTKSDEKSWLVSGKYKLNETPWAVKAQYVDTTNEKGKKGADATEVAVGAEYAFNKATTAHIYAGQISRDKNKDDTIVGTGLEYKF